MKIVIPTAVLAFSLFFAGAVMSAGSIKAKAPKVTYKQVQALLDAHCISCHGAKSHAAKIDLHNYGAVMASNVVVKGKPTKSRLVQYVDGSKQPKMPMGQKALSAAEVTLLKTWISQGAKA